MPIPPIRPYPLPEPDDLPANTAPWTLNPRRAVLLVHDMQKYFLGAFPAGQQPVTALVENATALRERCAELGVPVCYTAQPGRMTERQRGLLRDFWGPGMTTTPEHRAVVDPLAPAPDDQVFTKWRYSAFHRTGLLDFLRDQGRDQLVVCGVYAHVGCLITAVEAFSNDIETFLVADAVADFTEDQHRMALEYAAQQCAVVLPTGEALHQLGTAGAQRRVAS